MLGIVFVVVVGGSRSFAQVISPAAPNVNETEDAPPPVASRGGRGLGGAIVQYRLPWTARPRGIEGRTTTTTTIDGSRHKNGSNLMVRHSLFNAAANSDRIPLVLVCVTH
jgi:hypothetical protein